MAKMYTDLNSLAESLKPEINRQNQQIIGSTMSELESQASRLLSDINSLWGGYLSSYQPKQYIRTGATSQGFSLSNPRIVDDMGETKIEIDLVLDDGSMFHDSVMGSHYSQGHSFMLISEGWRWNGGLDGYKGGEVYRFTHFDGVGIVDTLINRYNTNKYDFKFYYEGEEYGGRRDRGSHSFTR